MESKNASKIILVALFVSIIFIDSLVILINSLVKAGIIWKSVEPGIESQEAFGGCSIEWQENFGGSGKECGFSVRQTTDGGYVIAGETDSFGAGKSDVYLVKTGPNGALQWQKTFGGADFDRGYSIEQTADGGFLIAGFTMSFGANGDAYLIKTDPNGILEWQNNYGGSDDESGYSVQQTADGGYIIAGDVYSAGDWDVYLFKTEPDGTLQWQKSFGGRSNDHGISVRQTIDGGYIVAGNTESFGADKADFYLIKTDINGTLEWQKTFGGRNYDYGYSVRQTTDGGYSIAGVTESFGAGKQDVYLVKASPEGNLEWHKTFGKATDEVGQSMTLAADGGYIIAGHTVPASPNDYGDVYIIKTKPDGALEWQNSFHFSNFDYGWSVEGTPDGGCIVTGRRSNALFPSSDDDVFLLKVR